MIRKKTNYHLFTVFFLFFIIKTPCYSMTEDDNLQNERTTSGSLLSICKKIPEYTKYAKYLRYAKPIAEPIIKSTLGEPAFFIIKKSYNTIVNLDRGYHIIKAAREGNIEPILEITFEYAVSTLFDEGKIENNNNKEKAATEYQNEDKKSCLGKRKLENDGECLQPFKKKSSTLNTLKALFNS